MAHEHAPHPRPDHARGVVVADPGLIEGSGLGRLDLDGGVGAGLAGEGDTGEFEIGRVVVEHEPVRADMAALDRHALDVEAELALRQRRIDGRADLGDQHAEIARHGAAGLRDHPGERLRVDALDQAGGRG
ncbi:hypothetical protein BK022_27665 [Methylorubrum extorquens]|uniref:Uncharacterized protein n=1 Tax=Methylorubrum extorquens TaxID=408 RepID=A0A1S1NI12_METEX|nr:hypothetical protein BK022_27665 [Methylorubrum extorquens]